ncbi:uncharacterized protein STEHIDRAFT_114457 [Stereum hirsutum FP-91666 SS1]|uniref:uncharacterized protein n=1 Tax=Stereum hirsutum (strain FP-91666) TaxID=721885 RepID=UPI000444937D|nr:uncharacterized protein STEHIDRAFT_114457 [Stereum hirsutum FP-91666 SS1]EIM82567.1 hypothetical protein STEHIDRAFT_114457 [Stereum hirsutum FP-91666 SS1]
MFVILPRRIINRAFICGIIIGDHFSRRIYQTRSTISPEVRRHLLLQLNIRRDWDLYDWTIYSQTGTVGLCVFGLGAGLTLRELPSHSYRKWLLCIGWVIPILCYVVMLCGRGKHATAIVLAWTQILKGLGGGNSVVCVKDMGIVISNLALWTKLFGATSTAVGEYPNIDILCPFSLVQLLETNHRALPCISNDMPANLDKYLTPVGVNATAPSQARDIRPTILERESSKLTTTPSDLSSSPRSLRIISIDAFIPLFAALCTTNFYLGKTQNAVDGKLHPMYRVGADNPNQRHDDYVGEQSESENEKGGVPPKGVQESELGRRT